MMDCQKVFSVEKCFNFYGLKMQFKSPMINRILHSWSFHIKLMKLPAGFFYKFHTKSYPLMKDPLLSTCCTSLAGNKLITFCFIFSLKTGINTTGKLSHSERVCIKCHPVFLGKLRAQYFKMSSAELLTLNAKH